jgi:tellurite methyltransferase
MSQQDRSAGWAAYYDKLRDRPPRKTAIAALDAFGAIVNDETVIDLGCGDGRDIVEMVRRGWNVIAVDAEPAALQQLSAREMPDAEKITPITARLEDVPLPIGLRWVNSSFAMPLCEPGRFYELWARIIQTLPKDGRFSGQWYGTRDSWNGRPGITFLERNEALALLNGFDLEMFDEEESDSVTPRGNPKHWHIFHIVARRR